MEKAFFKSADVLANIFTQENQLSPQEAKFFAREPNDAPGCKAIEVFENDISENLQEWAVTSNEEFCCVYYKTENYWYKYSVPTPEYAQRTGTPRVIFIMRIRKGTSKRIDIWINLHSSSVGKEWLLKPPQKAKKVPLLIVHNV